MTPDRRLDQLEPLMADSLQKIDRLIEGQGQLVELAVTTRAELDQVKKTLGQAEKTLNQVGKTLNQVGKTGELTASGLANLTVSTQQQFEQLKAGQDELKSNMELILQILREKLS